MDARWIGSAAVLPPRGTRSRSREGSNRVTSAQSKQGTFLPPWPAGPGGAQWWAPTIWSSTSVANLTLLEPVSALEDCTPVEGAFLPLWPAGLLPRAPGPLS